MVPAWERTKSKGKWELTEETPDWGTLKVGAAPGSVQTPKCASTEPQHPLGSSHWSSGSDLCQGWDTRGAQGAVPALPVHIPPDLEDTNKVKYRGISPLLGAGKCPLWLGLSWWRHILPSAPGELLGVREMWPSPEFPQ